MVRACIMTMLPCCISIVIRRLFRFLITRSTTTEKRKRIQLLMYPLQIHPAVPFHPETKTPLLPMPSLLKTFCWYMVWRPAGSFPSQSVFWDFPQHFSRALRRHWRTTYLTYLQPVVILVDSGSWGSNHVTVKGCIKTMYTVKGGTTTIYGCFRK